MDLSRRDLAWLAPAFATTLTKQAAPKPTLTSEVYKFEGRPVKPIGENVGCAVFEGKTHPGYPVELHMASSAPGSRRMHLAVTLTRKS